MKKKPFTSGFCTVGPQHTACKGEFENGSLAPTRTTLCSCSCHGVYLARMISSGYIKEEAEQ